MATNKMNITLGNSNFTARCPVMNAGESVAELNDQNAFEILSSVVFEF